MENNVIPSTEEIVKIHEKPNHIFIIVIGVLILMLMGLATLFMYQQMNNLNSTPNIINPSPVINKPETLDSKATDDKTVTMPTTTDVTQIQDTNEVVLPDIDKELEDIEKELNSL